MWAILGIDQSHLTYRASQTVGAAFAPEEIQSGKEGLASQPVRCPYKEKADPQRQSAQSSI
jgi:hypothetical protein